MSDVQTCEVCGHQAYASSGEIARKTVECVADDGMILAHDWTLCAGCGDELVRGSMPTCPWCLEPVMQDEDPRECPQRPEADR